MNIRTTLMLMAATVAAPLSAHQPAEPPATQTAPAAPQATAEQRAAALPALAILPADCDFCFTFTNLPAFIDSMHQANFIDDDDYADIPRQVRAIHSVAIGGGKDASSTANALVSIYNAYKTDALLGILEDITESASKDYQATLKAAVNQVNYNNKEELAAVLASAKIAPTYGVLLATPDYEGVIAEWYQMLISQLERAHEAGAEAVSIDGYNGLKLYMPENEAKPRSWDSATDIAIKQEIVKRTFYILFKLEGNKIIAVICENPEDICTAATPQESILGTDKLAKADAKLNQGLHCAYYAAPGIAKSIYNVNAQTYIKTAQGIGSALSALAEKHGTEQPVFSKAATGMQTIIQSMQQLFDYPIDSPTVGTFSWSGNAMDIDHYADNCGITYAPGKLALSERAANPSTILYAETTYTRGLNLPSLSSMLSAGIDVADGIIAVLPNKEAAASAAKMQQIKEFLPLATETIDAICTTVSGLDNTAAIIIDNQAVMPALLGGDPSKPVAFPRIAFYSGVSNRAKLSEGWDALLNVAGKAASKAGANPAIVNMLPIAQRHVGKAVSYSISLPWFTDNVVPNLTLSDTAFVVGSSSVLNAELAETAAPTVDYSGTVCTVRLAPLDSLLRSIADDLTARADAEASANNSANNRKLVVSAVIEEDDIDIDLGDEIYEEEELEKDVDIVFEDEEKKKPAVVAVVAEEDEEEEEAASFDAYDDYADEEDYDEEDTYTYYEPSPAERRARNFRTFADLVGDMARYVDSFNVNCTTDDDTAHLRFRVNLK